MKRGFIFMLDAFIALLVVLAFVSTLSNFNRDYSYVQDEALYSQGRNIMDVLLFTKIDVENRGEIPLIHALKLNEGKMYWKDNVKPLIPENVNYTIEYYDGSKWVSFGSIYNTFENEDDYYVKSISVISSIPIITRTEEYKAPYTYPDSKNNLCAIGVLFDSSEEGSEDSTSESSNPYEHVCGLWDNIYTPDEFNGNSSINYEEDVIIGFVDNWEQTENYESAFVRVVVKV